MIPATTEPTPSVLPLSRRSALWLRYYIPRVYLMRFPLLLAVFLVGFVFFAQFGLPAMFRSMLILSSNGVAAVTIFTVSAAFTALATRRVVALYGPARFGVEWRDSTQGVGVTRNQLAVLVMVAPIVTTTVWLSATEGRIGWASAIWGGLKGIFFAGLFAGAATVLHALFVDAAEDLPDIVLPADTYLVRKAHHQQFPLDLRRFGRVVQFVTWLRGYLGPGYFSDRGAILPAHLFSAGLITAFVLLYISGYFLWQPGTVRGSGVPALVYLLIVVTLATWLLSAVAFYLDRYRLPTLLTLAFISSFVWLISNSDHYFYLEPLPSPPPFDYPEQIAKDRKHPILTVVAVDGGGIQASGWAATVLTGIIEEIPVFQQSVRFISSVSGGSLGTMYFVGALDSTIGPAPQKYARVREFATRGSLNEVAWGLAYPDLMRVFVPAYFPIEGDRGWAMEQAWTRDWMDKVPTLSEWRVGIKEGWRPAIAFNASRVESGERFSFGTFMPPDQKEGDDWHLKTPLTLFGRDISVATAARMSATFPYVSPIARARTKDGAAAPADHFADGGYYDNSGMGIAMRWLDEAMRHRVEEYKGRDVVFIRIRSGPNRSDTVPKNRGWLYETIGPIQTLLAVRTAGQWERAETELDYLHRMWCDDGVDIRRFEFAFDRADPPLSWQLSPKDKDRLALEWSSSQNKRQLDELKVLLTEHQLPNHCTQGS